jgi:hypothetical protein
MTLDDIYKTIQSSPGGSSGRGMSFWKQAAACGRAANLSELYKEVREVSTDPDQDPNALMVGVYYHALHEIQLRGQGLGEVWDQTDTTVEDPSWLEAVRLYRAYQKDWGSCTNKWGAVLIGTEVKIPSTAAGETAVKDLFGDVTTGRMDALLYIPDSNLESIYERTGLLLPSGGHYILDHKTAKSRGDKHMWEYTFGLQSITYMHIYNMEHPTAPVQGMIFDQIYKHAQISKEPLRSKAGDIKRDSSYEAFLAVPNHGEEKVIQSLVQLGKKNVEEDRANPAHCFAGFKPCRFFTNGQCGRY